MSIRFKLVSLRNNIKRVSKGLPFLVGRSEQPYATHIPVLVGLSQLLPIRHVLEFGSGRDSTLLFLNPQIFPKVESLDSYENDAAWYAQVAPLIANDSRAKINFVEGEIKNAVQGINFSKYDLVFIDDSTTSLERSRTILEVIRHSTTKNLVTIHDFEIEDYRLAAREFKNQFTFTALNPNTGLLSKMPFPIEKKLLIKLNKCIHKNSSKIDPDDISAWKTLLQKELKIYSI